MTEQERAYLAGVRCGILYQMVDFYEKAAALQIVACGAGPDVAGPMLAALARDVAEARAGLLALAATGELAADTPDNAAALAALATFRTSLARAGLDDDARRRRARLAREDEDDAERRAARDAG